VQASSDGKGVEITEVAAGSPAAKAGLQQGDVITALDGKDVTAPDAVRTAVQAKSSGDDLSVTYTRGGQSKTVDVTLTSRSQAQSS
jgi:putative serine protease PepD